MKGIIAALALASVVISAGCSGSGNAENAGSGDARRDDAKVSQGSAQKASRENSSESKASGFKEDVRRESAAGLSFEVPLTWKGSEPSSTMRAAQFTIPGAGQEGEPGELVLFFFGAGQGGGTQANIDRWTAQFSLEDGSPAKDKAVTESRTYGPFKVTTVRVDGTYAGASMMPGMAGGESSPGYRMWAAVVEGTGGPWFFKAVGPQKVIEDADPAFAMLLGSVRPATD